MDFEKANKTIDNIIINNLCDYCLSNFDDLEKIQEFIKKQQETIKFMECCGNCNEKAKPLAISSCMYCIRNKNTSKYNHRGDFWQLK